MNARPLPVHSRRRLLVGAAALVIAIAVGLLLRLALHRTVPCGSGMSTVVPSACSGPTNTPATLPAT